jgi:hypothetical protein
MPDAGLDLSGAETNDWPQNSMPASLYRLGLGVEHMLEPDAVGAQTKQPLAMPWERCMTSHESCWAVP